MRRNDRTGLPALLAMAALMSTAYAQGPGIYFNRVTTPRREIAAGPAQGTGRAASSQEPADDTAGPFTSRTPGASSSSPAYSSRAQEPKAPPAPPTRTTQHSYYPGMRDGQNPNRNVPLPGRSNQARSPFLSPGMMGALPPSRAGAAARARAPASLGQKHR